MPYIENPKTKGSGIVCAIPQKGTCPAGCKDCFFQSGRSYLEPLDKNVPNMPSEIEATNCVVRVNDGNDSNNQRELVLESTKHYRHKFYNTSKPMGFEFPWVLTVNPGMMTDVDFYRMEEYSTLDIKSMMFVRFRINTWNINLAEKCVSYYTSRGIPVVLSFMAYWKYEDSIPKDHVIYYIKRKRTTNEYLAITHDAWRKVMNEFENNTLVHSCGTEGIDGGSKCKNCGNCLREYYRCLEKMRMIDK